MRFPQPSPRLFKRRLAAELEVKAAREKGLPEWQIDAIKNCDTGLMQDIVRDSRAPQGPSSQGVIPSSQQLSNVRPAGGGTGWQASIPLSNPPGTAQADRIVDEFDRRDRAELAQRLAGLKR
jgi:hypothetical protein